tara:strand:+ start:223 stop:573 length:351 start_codon:yes stop_codon:yes gene_type:complete
MSRPSTKFIPANLKQQLGAVSNAYNSNENRVRVGFNNSDMFQSAVKLIGEITNDVVGPHTVAGGLAGNTKKNRHTKKTSKNTRCGNGTSTQTTSNCTCAAVCSGGIASPAAYRNGY